MKELCIILLILILIIIILYYNNREEFTDSTKITMDEIDAFIYINLENRVDRKELLLNEFKKLNIPENKIYKISGVPIPKNGHKGCVQSHVLALELAKLNKWKNVAIIEDDMELNVSPDEFKNKLNKALTKKWDVIILHGSNQIKKTNIDSSDDLYYLEHSTQSTGYIINEHYYDTLLKLFRNCNNNMDKNKWRLGKHEPYALDQKWNDLINKDKWIGFTPNLIKQRNISSSINI
jgi:GR25 family glycosyltransferase involved in LPS biosynthesis